MSYTIYVTRDLDQKNAHSQITYEEWDSLAKADPEFEPSDELSTPNKVVYFWRAHPDHPVFHFSQRLGIGVRIRDLSIFLKMFEIAGKLSGIVEGENTERYRLTSQGVEQFFEDPEDGPPSIVCFLDN